MKAKNLKQGDIVIYEGIYYFTVSASGSGAELGKCNSLEFGTVYMRPNTEVYLVSSTPPRFGFFYDNRQGWFRIFGYGLKWKDTDIYGKIFSERVGMQGLQIGKWRIGVLKP